MSDRVKSSLKFILFFGIGVLLMYFAFRNINLHQMLSDLGQAHFQWVGLSLVFSIIALFSRSYRWGMLIEASGKKPKLRNLFYSVCSGYIANLAFPRLGEVTRCTALYEVEGNSFDLLVGTVIAERVIDFVTLLVLIFITLVSNLQLFGHFFSDLFHKKLSFLSSIHTSVFIIIAAFLLFFIFLLYLSRQRLKKLSFFVKIIHFLKGIVQGLQSVLKLKNRLAFLFHSVFIWFLYYLSTYVSFQTIAETNDLGFSAALFILVLGGLGMSAPVQGGLGAYHLLVAAGLALYGLDANKGYLFATIALSSQWLLILVLGVVSIVMLNVEKRRQLQNEKT